MHIEMSLDQQHSESDTQDEKVKSNPEDTQTISGSQVACSFGRMDAQRENNKQDGWQSMVLASLASVMVLAGLFVSVVLLI